MKRAVGFAKLGFKCLDKLVLTVLVFVAGLTTFISGHTLQEARVTAIIDEYVNLVLV